MKSPTRRNIIYFFLNLIASAFFTAKAWANLFQYTLAAKTYYVSNDGSDSNSGLSAFSPLKSLDAVSKIALRAGDTVKLRCGDTFFGEFKINGPTRSSRGAKITCTSYGIGRKPKVSGFKSIAPNSWTSESGGIWSVLINNYENYNGNLSTVGADGANIGFLMTDGVVRGSKKNSVADLQDDWDFFSDEENTLYVMIKSGENPAQKANTILAAPRVDPLLPTGNALRIAGIFATGTGGNVAAFNASAGIEIEDCVLQFFGGSCLHDGRRYGNGIQFWVNCAAASVKNTQIQDGYDSAVTCQGFPLTNPGDGWRDILISNVQIENCNQSVEFWNQSKQVLTKADVAPVGSGIHNFVMQNCKSLNDGGGWSANVRPDGNVGCHLLMYTVQGPVFDVSIKKCIFQSSRVTRIMHKSRLPAIPEGLKFEENIWITPPGLIINDLLPETVEEWGSFRHTHNIGLTDQVRITATSVR